MNERSPRQGIEAMGWHEAVHETAGFYVDRAVLAEAKLARIEALCQQQERKGGAGLLRAGIDNIRAILAGGDV